MIPEDIAKTMKNPGTYHPSQEIGQDQKAMERMKEAFKNADAERKKAEEQSKQK